MKRKAEKLRLDAPVSAFAARKARQRLAQAATLRNTDTELVEEPPSKKSRCLSEERSSVQSDKERGSIWTTRPSKEINAPSRAVSAIQDESSKIRDCQSVQETRDQISDQDSEEEEEEEEESEESATMEAGNGDGDYSTSLQDNIDSYESPADTAGQVENFPLSKTRLSSKSLVYSDDHTVCLRIREKMSMVILGQYDIWVKRGVISLMGAKLRASPKLYRVYAPSTNSLPVIKCVSGVNGDAEIEIKSCNSGLSRLKDLSPLYQRIWNGKRTSADKFTLKGASEGTKRTFSMMYTSADDSLKRHLRPLHLDKSWSSAMRELSRRNGQLKVLICGPKSSGKSTFGRYLLNHLLSPAPEADNEYSRVDGVAFIDLDPGQPEFSPMGQVYLAHLRFPLFGPPFTHPSLEGSQDGTVVRAHHIGATSPKDDPDHYKLAILDLMEHYRALLTRYPQCPLIINYPGWIFGMGLEIATWAVRSLGLSDVVYMSDKGPAEVLGPLTLAAREVAVPLTTLPSQPTDFVSRSSAQLRSMQMQSYFHMSHSSDLRTPLWSDTPIFGTRPLSVDYAGRQQGIQGIMAMGAQISSERLYDVIDGAIVAVVAAESANPIMGQLGSTELSTNPFLDNDGLGNAAANGSLLELHSDTNTRDLISLRVSDSPPRASAITRTLDEDLPYLFVGSGSCSPLDPKTSSCLGLALVRSIDVTTHKLELVTPIPVSTIHSVVEQGQGIFLVRGQLGSPNWAISEGYYASRAAEKGYQRSDTTAKAASVTDSRKATARQDGQSKALPTTRGISITPWMTVVDDRQGPTLERSLWKIRKKAYPGSDSEAD